MTTSSALRRGVFVLSFLRPAARSRLGRLRVNRLLAARLDGKLYYGNASRTDIIEAAVRAYLNAVNKFLAIKGG